MTKEYQITLMSTTGKYRPVSAIIKQEQENEMDLSKNKTCRTTLINRGVEKICAKRYWTAADLKKYGYTKVKIREYDKVKIDADNKARYEQIKEEKYNSGEWKRPKNK